MFAEQPVAIIDIGSNSVRLVVYSGATRIPSVIFNEKVLAGLGKDVGETGAIAPEAEARALAAEQAVTYTQAMAKTAEQARTDAQARERELLLARARAESPDTEEAEERAHASAQALIRAAEAAKQEAITRAEAALLALEEARTQARLEAEARTAAEQRLRAETEARERRERESTLHEHAAQEERAAADARIRAQLAELEQQAHDARAEAETRAAAETEARAAAEARAVEERRARIIAEHNAHSERVARAAAEDRAQSETVTRVLHEAQLRERAQEEIEARVNETLKARDQAEMQADAKTRTEARARAEAAARKREAEEQIRATAPTRRRKHSARSIALVAAAMFGILLLGAITLVQFVPLYGMIPRVQTYLSARLGMPVTIADMQYTLLPSPQLQLRQVVVGDNEDMIVSRVTVDAAPWTLLGASGHFSRAELDGVRADERMVAALPAWTTPHAGHALSFDHLVLRGVRVDLPQMDLPPLRIDARFDNDGGLVRSVFTADQLTVTYDARTGALTATAHGWTPPLGPAFTFEDLDVEARLEPGRIVADSVEGTLANGKLTGGATLTWAGPLTLAGHFALQGANLKTVLQPFTRLFNASGTINLTGTYALAGSDVQTLFVHPRVDARFTIDHGMLENVDILRAARQPHHQDVRGGRTTFDELSGTLSAAQGAIRFGTVRLRSGPMSAKGMLSVSDDSALAGHIAFELRSQSIVAARANLAVAGSVRDPVLQR
jgi:hypothetical protein